MAQHEAIAALNRLSTIRGASGAAGLPSPYRPIHPHPAVRMGPLPQAYLAPGHLSLQG